MLLEKIDKKDFVAGVVGQNIVLEGIWRSRCSEMLHAGAGTSNPKFARTLSGTIADESGHVGFGENRIGELIRRYPEKKPEVQRMQRDMTRHMLATFHGAFAKNGSPAETRTGAPQKQARSDLSGPQSGRGPNEMEGRSRRQC